MIKFLIKATYTPEGVKGLLNVGGTNRRKSVEKMVNGLGGRIEAFYYAFGEQDVYSIGEVPDDTSLVALALAINSSGLVSVSTTILLSPEEIDKATKLSVDYRPPGK